MFEALSRAPSGVARLSHFIAMLPTMATKNVVDGIRAYLNSLGASSKPQVDREAVRALKTQIREETDSINKLKLLAQLEQEEAGRVPDFSGERAEFVAEAKAWAESESVPVSAFQALGVSDEVLRQAGFEVSAATTRSSAAGGARRAGSGTGKRAAALPLDEVAAAARKLGSGWKLTDLAVVLEREPMTVRNYVNKLMEQGVVSDLGDDPHHDGRGRAAKIYGVG